MKRRYVRKSFPDMVRASQDGSGFELGEGKITIPLTGVKRYYHTLFLLFNLSGVDRVFLDWLTEVMGIDNRVYINDDEIERFLSVARSMGYSYKASTVKQSFKRLRARNLILKTKKASGLFHVNPIFYAKGTEKQRIDNICMLFNFEAGDSFETNMVKVDIFNSVRELIDKAIKLEQKK